MSVPNVYTVLQPHYNLVGRTEYEGYLAPIIAEHNRGVVPSFSLASRFLSGKYRKAEDLAGQSVGRTGKYLKGHGFQLLAALDEVAQHCNATNAQVALAKAGDLTLDEASIAQLNAPSDDTTNS